MYTFKPLLISRLTNGKMPAPDMLRLPDDTELAFRDESGKDSYAVPEKSYYLLVTDKKEDLEKCRAEDNRISYTVWCGEGDADNADAFVTAGMSEAMFRTIIERGIENLKASFDAYIYKNSMIALMDSLPDMVWFKDLAGTYLEVNKVFSDVVEKSKEDCRKKPHAYIWDMDAEATSAAASVISEADVINAGHTLVNEEPLQTKKGMKQLTTYKSPVFDVFGQSLGTIGVGHDVTNFNNMGLQLSILIENMPLPLILCGLNHRVIQMNSKFRDITGLDMVALASFDYNVWKDKYLTPISDLGEDKLSHSRSREYTIEMNGNVRYFRVVEQEVIDHFGSVSGYYCMFMDTTMSHKYENTILKAANTDALTGLFNRRYFYDKAAEYAGEPIKLLYMDLDHFKEINDNYGHNRGDDVLKKTANYISECFPDGICARLGGDEYAVLLHGEAARKDVSAQCAKLEDQVRHIFRSGGLFVTISIGISESEGGLKNVDAFIHGADQKMYEIKKKHHEEMPKMDPKNTGR